MFVNREQDTKQESSTMSFQPGINSGFRFVGAEVIRRPEDGSDRSPFATMVIKFETGSQESPITRNARIAFWDFDPEKTTIDKYMNGIAGKQNVLKSVITNWCTDDEYYDLMTNSLDSPKTPEDFIKLSESAKADLLESYVDLCMSLVPQGFEEEEGHLILMKVESRGKIYDNVPDIIFTTGRVFSLDLEKKPLQVSDEVKASAKLTAISSSTEEETNDVSDDEMFE